jgi:hypothetical protein
MATRTIELVPKNLEGGIEALSSAARAFQLTPFERNAYRALMVSADATVWASVALILEAVLVQWNTPFRSALDLLGDITGLVIVCGVFVATVALALNILLAYRLYRERTRLKELGLASLSNSLWKETRRRRWMSRTARWVPAIVLLIAVTLLVGNLILSGSEVSTNEIIAIWVLSIVAGLLIFSGYLRNQRERMDLAASAEELKKALEGLQQLAGKAEVVSVPSELLEQAARIETAQIAKERKDAVLQSVAVRPSGYAITFDRDAAEERATLSVADRLELEDVVAQLSTEGAQPLPSLLPLALAGAERATMTKSKRVEIVYVIDRASRGIRIIAVRHGGGGSHNSPNGHSHA